MMRNARFGSASVLVALAFATASGAVRAQVPFDSTPVASADDLPKLERELSAASAEFDRLTDEARRLESEEQGVVPRREAITRRARAEIRWLYHLVQGEPMALQGGPEALLEHIARVNHVRRALRTTLRELHEATERGTTVRVDRARTQVALSDVQERRSALEASRRQLELLGGMRLTVTAAGLSGQLAPSAGPSVTLYGGAVSATAPDTTTFANAAGRLLFPVAGRAEVRRAQREGAEGPGLEIVAPLGTPVRAVFGGRVAFADRYGAYGRIVILEHGDHHYTVSANLGSMNVRVGEEIAAGSVVGTVGDDGRGPMLYFEVRRGSETVDPGPWLGL